MPAAAQIALTLLTGGFGAAVLTVASLPAGPIVGSSVAVAAAAIAGIGVRKSPHLQQLGFSLAGLGLGSNMSIDTEQIARWPLSIVFLLLSIVTIIACGGMVLRRGFGYDRTTALLSSLPGALSQSVAIAVDEKANVAAVLTSQCLRLIVTVLSVSMLATATGISTAPASRIPAMPLVPCLLLTAVALATGVAAARLRVPAAFFLAGLMIGAGFHLSAIVSGPIPAPLMFAGFVLIGSAVGTGFSTISRPQLRAYSVAALVLLLVASAISGLFAVAASWLFDMPFIQVWAAYSPGGVEAMAAIALSLHLDPAYVAAHHLIRIMFLSLALVFLMRGS